MCSNNALVDISGFNELASIDSLYIANNVQLSTISGFQKLTSTQSVHLSDNASLTTLEGAFPNINPSLLASVSLTNNVSLSLCSLTWLCEYLHNNGKATISGNSPECNSTASIQASCQVLAIEDDHQQDIYVYPNPVNDILHFSIPLQYSLYNVFGKLLMQGQEAQASVAELPQGVYFLKAAENQGSFRIIKD